MEKDRERAENSLMLQEGETILDEMETNSNYNISQLKYIAKQSHLDNEQENEVTARLSKLRHVLIEEIASLRNIITAAHREKKKDAIRGSGKN